MLAPETVFNFVNTGILPFWLLLAAFPFARVTRVAVHSAWLPLLLAGIYTAYIVVSVASRGGTGEGGFSSLGGVVALFASPTGVLIGWVHFLAFDLFVGAWQVREARRRGIPHLAVLPCLFFTLMLAPFGLALYLILRGVWKGAWSLDETVRSATSA